jgi:saccharopine dehydrogenase (NAD+, L-lysine-forming)
MADHQPYPSPGAVVYGVPVADDWMIYGANGYTGELVARLAVSRGERPILAGRNATALGALAAELDLDYRVADLRDPLALRRALRDVRAVAHCAGPFAETSAPMLAACLDAGAHYLDVTGEIDVFEAVFGRHEDAVAAGIALLPGAGFDVVPTDCLAALLFASLPTATSLELAFRAGGGLSPGTAKSTVAGMSLGGRVRRGGVLVPSPSGSPRRSVPFPSGQCTVSAIRWGDLVTAHRSTGIPDITTYTALPTGAGLSSVMAWQPLRSLATRLVKLGVRGPDAARRAASRCEVWGEVRDATGEFRTGTLIGPNAYDLTADSVVRAVALVLAGGVTPGAHTPSSAFGSGYAETLDGVSLTLH